MLDLFTETKQWKKAIEILMQLAELESGKVKAKYLVAAGNIANYELHSTDEAVELYNQALDEDPDDLKAFERIDKIMTAKKDWKNQERNYRKMIKRIGQEPPAEKRKPTVIALWHALGEIYRSRLKDFKAATAAFEVCVQLDPDATARHQILAELYQLAGPGVVREGGQGVPAADQGDAGLRADGRLPQDAAPLFTEMRQYDRAWCVGGGAGLPAQGRPRGAAVLRAVQAQDVRPRQGAPHRGAVAEASTTPTRTATSRTVFATVSQAVAAAKAREHKDWGLKRKDKRDIANDQLLFSKVFNYVSQVLDVPQPELYLRPESPGELDMANAREKAQLMPSFVVGVEPAARAAREGAGLRHRQEADAHAAGSLRALADVVPTVAELKVGLPGGAEAGAAEVRDQGGPAQQPVRQYLHVAAEAGAAADDRAAGRGRAAVRRPPRARPTSARGRTRST